jgi:large subunit ribosomal protein L21
LTLSYKSGTIIFCKAFDPSINIQIKQARPDIYAIIETGGKQYKVAEGQTIDVELLGAEVGSTVEMDKVLLIADGDSITSGKPVIEGARVLAMVQKNGKGDKVIVFKYKPKTRYRRKNGHRQPFTTISIDKILPPGAEVPKPAKRTRRKKTEKAEETADGA